MSEATHQILIRSGSTPSGFMQPRIVAIHAQQMTKFVHWIRFFAESIWKASGMPDFFKSLSKSRNRSWLWAAILSAPAIVAACAEAVPWTVKIACVMTAICCSLWFWLNWPQLRGRFEGQPFSSPVAGQEKASTPKAVEAEPVQQPSVTFQLVGDWHQGPFRLTKLREQRALPELYAEDLYLRITAHKNLKNVYLIIKLFCNNALICELGEFRTFRGEVRKGAQEEILLFRHTFERVPASYTDYSTNAIEYLLARRTVGKYFFPSTPASYACPKESPPAYEVLIRALHGDGHESASLSVVPDAAPVPHSRVIAVADGIEIATDNRSRKSPGAVKDVRPNTVAVIASGAKQSRN